MVRQLSFFRFASMMRGQVLDVSLLELKNARAAAVQYRESAAVKLESVTEGDGLAVMKGSRFHNGSIELDVAGAPGKGAVEAARGFIGICFRIRMSRVARRKSLRAWR